MCVETHSPLDVSPSFTPFISRAATSGESQDYWCDQEKEAAKHILPNNVMCGSIIIIIRHLGSDVPSLQNTGSLFAPMVVFPNSFCKRETGNI